MHPREARIQESSSSSADLAGPNLNEGLEEDPDEFDIVADIDPEKWQRFQEKIIGTDAAARAVSGRAAKHTPSDLSRQQLSRVIDKAVGEDVKDWTKFDIGRSIRISRIGTEAQIIGGIRKLHLRWWHATRTRMEKILTLAGFPSRAIQFIPGEIDTCRECRA